MNGNLNRSAPRSLVTFTSPTSPGHCGRHGRLCWLLSAAMAAALTSLAVPSPARADDPPYIRHRDYQAVNPDGSSAYSPGGFPVRLVGVVLNNNEDWLDPASAFDPGFHAWQLGAQAEIYVQAVDLDAFAPWDPFPGQQFDDFGGTACWMGQNYGNHPFFHPPDPTHPEWNSDYNYTEPEWYAELDRLHLWRPGTLLPDSELVRAGDLVTVTARAGLNYKGKMNVNETHSNEPALDFELAILQKNYGLPEPELLTLADLKAADDTYLFDAQAPTREFGGERYQSSLVKLTNVRFSDEFDPATDWRAYKQNSEDGVNLTLVDPAGRTLPVHLGRNDSFDTNPAPQGSGRSERGAGQLGAASRGGFDGAGRELGRWAGRAGRPERRAGQLGHRHAAGGGHAGRPCSARARFAGAAGHGNGACGSRVNQARLGQGSGGGCRLGRFAECGPGRSAAEFPTRQRAGAACGLRIARYAHPDRRGLAGQPVAR